MKKLFLAALALVIVAGIAQAGPVERVTIDVGTAANTTSADGEVLFDNNGTVDGVNTFTYDDTNDVLTVGHIDADIATKTDSFTWALGDSSYLVSNSTGSITATVPPNSSVAFPTGSVRCFEVFDGANTGTIAAGSGVTINTNTSLVYTSASGCLVKTATDEWTAVGGD